MTELLPAIRSWLQVVRDGRLPTEPSLDGILDRAKVLIERLRRTTAESVVAELECETEMEVPDLLHAMIGVLDQGKAPASYEMLVDLDQAYQLVSRLSWHDEFDERQEMLARISFLAWNQDRLLDRYRSARIWQARCAEHTLAQEHIRNFFSLSSADKSTDLYDRFLTDHAVLLTFCDHLEKERNRHPLEASKEGESVYAWITERRSETLDGEDLAEYFAAAIALSVLSAKQNQVPSAVHELWSNRAKTHIRRSRGSAPIELLLEHLRLSSMYLRYQSSAQVISSCRLLIERLEALGMAENAVRTRYLLASIHYELGDCDLALELLEKTYAGAEKWGDLLVASQSLCVIAQILGARGNTVSAISSAQRALDLAGRSGCDWGVAFAQASIGQILRDNGSLGPSIDAYAMAVAAYETAAHFVIAAYVKVVLAETLLMAGRAADAAKAIVDALPVIETHNLGREAVAAVAILREAVHRQQTDPVALRQLREQLDQMHREHKL